MTTPVALTATTSTETFGLPAEASHLIGKLRNMPPEQRALILNTTPKDTK